MSVSFSGRERRAARMGAAVMPNQIIGTRTYNIVMGLVVAYGLVFNAILCQTGLGIKIAMSVGMLPLCIGYLVLAIGGTVLANRSNNALVSFLGYNMVVLPTGILVSVMVYAYGGVQSAVVGEALWYTFLITGIMILSAALFPQFFEKIGGFLFAGLIGVLICGLVSSIIRSFVGGTTSVVYPFICAVLFSLYIGYDFYRSQKFPKTMDNAVDCALDIYLDIINLFLRLLQILGRRK